LNDTPNDLTTDTEPMDQRLFHNSTAPLKNPELIHRINKFNKYILKHYTSLEAINLKSEFSQKNGK
jgi:hypothetical protein